MNPKLLIFGLTLTLLARTTFAGSATWDFAPASSDWNTPANWTPSTVPNAPVDVATFAASQQTSVTVSSNVEVASILFASGAQSYTISANPFVTLTISGSGLSGNPSMAQNFVAAVDSASNAGALVFTNNASAGAQTTFTNQANPTNKFAFGGATRFLGHCTAEEASLTNLGAAVSGGFGGTSLFSDSATADSAVITNKGGLASGAYGGTTQIAGAAHAAQAILTSEGSTVSGAGGGNTTFINQAHADSATLIATGGSNGGGGGQIIFINNSFGDNCRIELYGNGYLDISGHFGPSLNRITTNGPPVSIGSLEGDGIAMLGGIPLQVGSSNLSTTFAGVIEDGSLYSGGSLAKLGTGTFTLTGANTYTGGTTVSAGSLILSNTTGSATGTGAVSVNHGTLGGAGLVSGAIVVNSGGLIAPAAGTKKQATLTTASSLTFNAGATYNCTFKARRNQARNDQVTANGITINSGATFTLTGQVQGILRQGLTLTVLSNTSANPIVGAFTNLPDGGTITVGSTNFQANYEGGDGNDLTLTVVP